MTRRWTQILLVIVAFVLIGYDVWAALNVESNDTITQVVRDWAADYAVVPVGLGIVLGHWFWPVRRPRPYMGPALLGVWSFIFVLIDVAGALPPILPFFALVGGFIAGGALWGPQCEN